MLVWRNFQQESHDLVKVDNLQIVKLESRLEVRTPGKPDGLHHVGEEVIQLNLQLLSLSEIFGLVFLTTRHNVRGIGGRNKSRDAEIIIQRRQNLGYRHGYKTAR